VYTSLDRGEGGSRRGCTFASERRAISSLSKIIRGASDGIVLLLDFDATRNLANVVLVGESNDGTGSSSTFPLDAQVAVELGMTKESLDRFIVLVGFLCLVDLGVE